MRVRVGDYWYSTEADDPIAVELTDQDKLNILNMEEDCSRYGVFHDDEVMNQVEMLDWLKGGEDFDDAG